MQVDAKEIHRRGIQYPAKCGSSQPTWLLHQNIEHMVNCRKEISAQQRIPYEPPEGSWQTSAQPE